MSLARGYTIAGGRRPLAWFEDAAVPAKLWEAVEAQDGQVYLVELYPSRLGATRPARAWARPIAVGNSPIAWRGGAALTAGITQILYSDRGYTSPPRGSMGSTHFEGRAMQALQVGRSIPVTPESDRKIAFEASRIEINNADGALDNFLRTYSIDGRVIVVKFGLETYAYEDFATVYYGRALSWAGDFKRLVITGRDSTYQLSVPLQSDFYEGSGGVEGTDELKDKPKPVCFGKCLNITPILVDPANLVYQFHSRAVQGIDAVYDQGAALTAGTDYADYAALIAASVSAGYFATCADEGLFRLGSSPAGLITADVRGDAEGGYVDSTAYVAMRVFTDYALLGDGDLDLESFLTLEHLFPGEMGWYRGAEIIQANEAIDQIVGHCASYWGGTLDGTFAVGFLQEPDQDAVITTIESWDIVSAQAIDPPDGSSPPRYAQRVGYAKNWTVQRGEDLAAGVAAARRQVLAEPYSLAGAENPATFADFLLAQNPAPLESLFADEADAESLAQSLIDLLGVQRQAYKIGLRYNGHVADLGTSIAIRHPRINGGELFVARVIAHQFAANRQRTDIVIWG